jgi:hypothetical protein
MLLSYHDLSFRAKREIRLNPCHTKISPYGRNDGTQAWILNSTTLGKPARRDLCRGGRETGRPTATKALSMLRAERFGVLTSNRSLILSYPVGVDSESFWRVAAQPHFLLQPGIFILPRDSLCQGTPLRLRNECATGCGGNLCVRVCPAGTWELPECWVV